MVELCTKIVDSKWFPNFILAVILLAAVAVGLETYPDIVKRFAGPLNIINGVILAIFVVEIAVKMAAHGKHWYRYFYDPWNVFDFVIVVVCFLPGDNQYAAVLRLARVLRALRLMTALPQLQLIVGALIKSIPSLGFVGILLALNFYVYAVMGVFMFRDNDPIHFRDLPTAMLSLFRVATLEDWTDVMYINMYGSNNYPGPDIQAYQTSNNSGLVPNNDRPMSPLFGALFFVSFVMIGTMIILNLFIGVILNSMDETAKQKKKEQMLARREAGDAPTLDDDFDELRKRIEQLGEGVDQLALRMQLANNGKSAR
ncbi:MAG: ion transporter [Pirellulaceae bacterium]